MERSRSTPITGGIRLQNRKISNLNVKNAENDLETQNKRKAGTFLAQFDIIFQDLINQEAIKTLRRPT